MVSTAVASHEFDPDPRTPRVCVHCALPRANRRHGEASRFVVSGTTVPARQAAAAERDRVIASVNAEGSDWDKSLIDQAIRALCNQRARWSANDLRVLLPEVRPALIGARVHAAARRGWIRSTGEFVMSTDPRTRHRIAVWESTGSSEGDS